MDITVIAPAVGQLPVTLPFVAYSEEDYAGLIDEIQQFRGRIYVEDEAIPEEVLDYKGRHYSELDYHSWHIVARTARGKICGIMRIPVYPAGVDLDQLQLDHLLQRMLPLEQYIYRHTIRSFIEESSQKYPLLCEPGGWATDQEWMSKLTGTRLAAAVWGVMQVIDQAAGVATVTVKHKAAQLLKFMGGINPFRQTPQERFYDWFHGCEMEIIFFHCDQINPKFAAMVEEARAGIMKMGIITCQSVFGLEKVPDRA